jgi:hypothetical protein
MKRRSSLLVVKNRHSVFLPSQVILSASGGKTISRRGAEDAEKKNFAFCKAKVNPIKNSPIKVSFKKYHPL